MAHFRLFVVIFLFHTAVNAQSNDFEAAAYNVAFGGVFGGIGAVINKTPKQKAGKVFLNAFLKGAAGGYVVFESKRLLREVARQEDLAFAWPAKLVNATGISIIENAAMNRSFLQQYNLHIGFNRFEFHFEEKFELQYQVMPAALLGTLLTAYGNKFDIELSAKTGEPVFTGNSFALSAEFENDGANLFSAILIKNRFRADYSLLTHEILHTYQYYDQNVINTFLSKPIKSLNKHGKLFQFFDKLFYYDFQAPIGLAAYEIENLSADDYYDNYFEQEAKYYSEK